MHLCEYISKRVDFENMKNINNIKNGFSTNFHDDSTSGLMAENLSLMNQLIQYLNFKLGRHLTII